MSAHPHYNLLSLVHIYERANAVRVLDGFFDAGMLLQALKARGEVDSGETKASERAAVQARRRDVGKKLRLIDY